MQKIHLYFIFTSKKRELKHAAQFYPLKNILKCVPTSIMKKQVLAEVTIKNENPKFKQDLGDLRRRQWQPTQYSCLENPMEGGAWQAAVHGVTKSQTRLSNFTFTFHFQALEKEMATHSSVLAWRIQWTEELLGCRLWGRTESDTTEVTQQQHIQ